MKKNSKKKNTNNKLVNTVAKSAKPKKLGNKVVKGKNSAKNQKLTAVVATRKATANRNSFRRALYRANKIIKSGNSFYPTEKQLSMKEFKNEYQDFGKRTGMLKGKSLNKGLETFLANQINNKTPKQCESAVDNLMKHLNDAVSAYNGVEGDINKLSDANKKYIKVLEEINALKTKEKDGKTVYSIIEEKLPNSEDLRAVTNKYLHIKRIIIRYFGDKEYSEAYGS